MYMYMEHTLFMYMYACTCMYMNNDYSVYMYITTCTCISIACTYECMLFNTVHMYPYKNNTYSHYVNGLWQFSVYMYLTDFSSPCVEDHHYLSTHYNDFSQFP